MQFLIHFVSEMGIRAWSVFLLSSFFAASKLLLLLYDRPSYRQILTLCTLVRMPNFMTSRIVHSQNGKKSYIVIIAWPFFDQFCPLWCILRVVHWCFLRNFLDNLQIGFISFKMPNSSVFDSKYSHKKKSRQNSN